MGISIGLVGLGSFGSAFAAMFKHHPLVDRIALCDREPQRIAAWADREDFQDKFHPRDAYDSLEAICDSDLDALVVITQHWLHAPQAIGAMEAGKHVYSAVPVIWIPDADEILDWCDRLVQTVRTTGMKYMLGETTYYHADTMYCRRRAAEGAFGEFVYAEGEYYHDVDSPACSLRTVMEHRTAGSSGKEWLKKLADYQARGVLDGPMHYPTHSTSGPISVMGAHMTRVWALPYYVKEPDPWFQCATANETALFEMSNGAACRICEYRKIGHAGREGFRVYGTDASFENGCWIDKSSSTPMAAQEMRDPLPEAVVNAWGGDDGSGHVYGGHGGSHGYLVHEFVSAVAEDRMPAINVWEAVRYMAAGAVAHKSAVAGGEVLDVPDWGDAPA